MPAGPASWGGACLGIPKLRLLNQPVFDCVSAAIEFYMRKLNSKIITQTILAAAAAGTALAADAPAAGQSQGSTTQAAVNDPAPAGDNAVDTFFNGKIPDAIAKGKFSLNVRPRWEHAHQEGLEESDAFTIRTRFGYTTAPLYGFQAMVEGENVAVLGPGHNFNAAGSNGQGGRTVVADPPTTELNQAWLSYTNFNTLARAGRQRLTLDNHRFIGDVGWRQNMQTFDSFLLENKSLPYSTLTYGYIWDVNRVFGDVDNLPPGNTDFESDSHIFHYTYDHWKWLKINAYSYLLDLSNSAPGDLNSTATFGGFLAGNIPVHEKATLDYRGEFAWQTDYAGNALDYGAEYYNLELGATIKPVNFGVGYEVLGTDEDSLGAGRNPSFKTPLATLHAFNGWADVFLTTPPGGLRDLYAFAGVTLPYDIPLRIVVHDFRSETGGLHYGREIDAVISKKFGKHWTALAKYAYYDGKEASPLVKTDSNIDKAWVQVEFNY